jgi:hypothetical protein
VGMEVTPRDWQRFWSKTVGGPNGCILWTAGKGHLGHGQFWCQGRNWPAHQFAWVAAHGPVPAGLELDHLCRQTGCVNVLHLEPVTPRENSKRRSQGLVADRNGGCKHGHPASEYKRYDYDYGSFLICMACNRVHAERQRRKKGYGLRGEHPSHCKNGHPWEGNRTTDGHCILCRREQGRAAARSRGVPERGPRKVPRQQ